MKMSFRSPALQLSDLSIVHNFNYSQFLGGNFATRLRHSYAYSMAIIYKCTWHNRKGKLQVLNDIG